MVNLLRIWVVNLTVFSNYIGKLAKLTTINKLQTIENIDVAFVDGLIYEGKTSIDWLGNILTIDIAKKKIFVAE